MSWEEDLHNIIILDTETSDLDPAKGAALLELAWVNLEYVGGFWRAVHWHENYIQYDGPINPHARAVNHIRPSSLTAENGAVTRAEAISTLLQCMDDQTILVAHNVEFDSKFFPELVNQWLCTYRVAKHVWPDAPGYSNQVLRYWLGIDFDLPGRFPHQALYDIATTEAILQRMLQMYKINDLLQMYRSPIKMKTINFGKHKGTEFSNIPRDYLQWLKSQGNLDPDLKYTLESLNV